MSKLKTAIEFAKNIATVGAFKETSTKVEREICAQLSAEKPLHIVEFGMGHGNITRAILDRISPESTVQSFEINKEFCEHVRQNITDTRLDIINESAEDFKKHVSTSVDYIITSLPFSFFSKEARHKLLTDSYEVLHQGGCYSQILYAKWASKPLKVVFDKVESTAIAGLPPEHVFHCWKA